MGGELLRIVQAEDEADEIVALALARKEQAIKQALDERQARLAAVRAPILPPILPSTQTIDGEKLRALAKRNMRKAVKVILEDMHAQA